MSGTGADDIKNVCCEQAATIGQTSNKLQAAWTSDLWPKQEIEQICPNYNCLHQGSHPCGHVNDE